MRSSFARTFLPVVESALQLIEKAAGETTNPDQLEERKRFIEALEARRLKDDDDAANNAEMALVYAVDDILTRDNTTWQNSLLERVLYKDRLRADHFPVIAENAGKAGWKDTVEMCVVAVLIGFRGSTEGDAERKTTRIRDWFRSHRAAVIEGVRRRAEVTCEEATTPRDPAVRQTGFRNLVLASVFTAFVAAALTVVGWKVGGLGAGDGDAQPIGERSQ